MARAREVILGIGGGIAAYKSCDLLRRLQDRGYLVTVVPTPSSLNFVGAATWEALSGRPVTTQVWERVDEVRHVSLAKSADCVIIAPATADLIARIAAGRADDLLTNLILAVDIPILIVPAMHPQMWLDSATQTNVQTLRNRGYAVMEPDVGRLTGDDIGPGRFPETAAIIENFALNIGVKKHVIGKRVLETAGGTREAIDPVRYIGNKSSGKQGYAIAQAALDRGAEVTLLSANVSLPTPVGARLIECESTADLQMALSSEFAKSDLLIMAAAVADARPVKIGSQKLKKDNYRQIELMENPDLVAQLAKERTNQIIVGFAAETSLNIEEASRKLLAKGLDLIYLNDVSTGEIFGSETTQGLFISKDGSQSTFSKGSKATLANQLLDLVVDKLN